MGITVDGISLQTDPQSVAAMAGYVTESVIDGLVDITWKCLSGTFHTYTVQEFKPVFKKIKLYVHDCFENEAALSAALDAAADPTTIDLTAGWPTTEYTTS